MTVSNLQEHVGKLIAQGNYKKAFEEALAHCSKRQRGKIISLSGNFNRLEEKMVVGLITSEIYQVEVNKLTNALLKVVSTDTPTQRRRYRRPALIALSVLILAITGLYFFTSARSLNGYIISKEWPIPDVKIEILDQEGQLKQIVIPDSLGYFQVEDLSFIGDSLNMRVLTGSQLLIDSMLFKKDVFKGNILLKLPLVNIPFEIEYVLLRGNAINYLFQDQLITSWDSLLSDGPSISYNQVYKEIEFLNRNFYYTFDEEALNYVGQEIVRQSAINKEKKVFEIDSISAISTWEWLATNSFLEGTETSDYHPENHVLYNFSRGRREQFLSSIRKNPDQWHLIIDDNIEAYDSLGNNTGSNALLNYESSTHLIGFADANMINTYLPPFYKFITKKGVPQFFLPVEVRNYLVSCYQEQEGLHLNFQPPFLQLRIAIVENNSNRPIKIGDFSITEVPAEGLRTYQENESSHNKLTPKKKRVYPKTKVLDPGKEIIIPLEISFYYHEDDYRNMLLIDSLVQLNFRKNLPAKVRENLNSIEHVSFLLNSWITMFEEEAELDTFNIDIPSLTRLLNPKSSFKEKLPRYYVYDHSVKIHNLEVDGIDYPFRAFDPDIISIQNGWIRGSCPYAFSFNEKSKEWELEDHILYGMSDPTKEGMDTIPLNRFTGKLQIREIDPETSYIDFLQILVKDKWGNSRTLSAHQQKVKSIDKEYLIMNQGDQVLVEFESNTPTPNAAYYLISKGYYVPYLQNNLERRND